MIAMSHMRPLYGYYRYVPILNLLFRITHRSILAGGRHSGIAVQGHSPGLGAPRAALRPSLARLSRS